MGGEGGLLWAFCGLDGWVKRVEVGEGWLVGWMIEVG